MNSRFLRFNPGIELINELLCPELKLFIYV